MDEKDLSERIKKLDFSRYSANHKEQLWKTLNERSGRRVLLEHELEISAALNVVSPGVPHPGSCAKCGSKNINSKGQCSDCKHRNLP